MNFLAKRHELRWTLWVDGDFRKRSEAALTHPATVAALAVLLLNDMAFKSMWPGSWITGKLSDLVWVTFGLPLLAFLLSFLAGRSAFGQRSAFLASYVGLPLLYAAFNTFAPVHDAILRGLSIVSGDVAGSPLDVSDSIVIPFGLGIALWVWRRDLPSAKSLRRRCALLMAGVAALASVASSVSEPEVGIQEVGVSGDGEVYAGVWNWLPTVVFQSTDGGLTWNLASDVQGLIEEGGATVNTPRGAYMIEGANIVLVDPDGVSRVVHSTAYMGEEANVWTQERATGRLGGRETTTAPRSIIYDERSGNLIAAMGIQGVLVGAPDGSWTMRAVGRYSPVDFSFLGKTALLLSKGDFWMMAFALSLSMTGLALAATVRGATAQEKSFQWGLGILALIASVLLLLTADGSDAEALSGYDLRWFILGVPAYVFGITALAISGSALRHWRVAVPAFLVMTGLVTLAFMLWLHLGIPLALAQISAIVLVGLVAVVQVRCIKSLDS